MDDANEELPVNIYEESSETSLPESEPEWNLQFTIKKIYLYKQL
mgnify:CR=1 FL=1